MSVKESTKVQFRDRFAHSEGHTCLCFANDGKTLMTGGIDGDVRHWSLSDEDEEPRSFDVGNSVNAVVLHNDKFYVATDGNELRCYSLDDGEETTVTRFTAGIYHLDLNEDGSRLVAGGGDFTIKIVNLDDFSQISLTGHEAPILCASFDPKNEFIASSSCDGTVRIWNISDKKCVHVFNNHEKSNELVNSKTLCYICWEKTGDHLVVPSEDKVNVYSRNDWKCIRSFTCDGFSDLSITSLCPNNEYLAAANNSGILLVWKYSDKTDTPVASFIHPKKIKITSLQWNPTVANSINFCDSGGQLYSLTASLSDNQTIEESNDMYADLCNDLLLDDEDLTEENFENNLVAEQKTAMDIDDQQPTNSLANDGFDEDDDVLDIGAIKAEYEPKIFPVDDNLSDVDHEKVEKIRVENNIETASVKSVVTKQEYVPPVKLQSPFQPGSTPIEYQHRFMVWNEVGVVSNYNTEEENSIDVEFHDTTVHHSIHFTNTYNYVMADLSTEALLCANRGDELVPSSRLFCMHFGTWDANKEWKYNLPDDEYVDVLGLGNGFAVIATDQRFIRLFTICGIQLQVLSFTGPVVSLAAQELSFVVVYHNGAAIPNEQSMSAMLMKVDLESSFVQKDDNIPVPLTPKSNLYWIGFTDEGTPCIVDSSGVVRLYKKVCGNSWIPILDTKKKSKSKSDHFFVVGLSEIQQQIRCIASKGSLYPQTIPRPTLLLLDFEIPLCELTNTRSQTEEQFLRMKLKRSLLHGLLKQGFDIEYQCEETESKTTSTLLKMFALALNENSECLAMEIANLMPNKTSLELASRYALQRKKTGLMKKLSELVQRKEEIYDQHAEDDSKNDSQSIMIKPQVVSKKDEFVPKPKQIIRKKTSDFEDDVSSLRPKPLNSSKLKSSNSLKDDNSEEMSRNKKANGFDLFFQSMKEQIMEEYPDVDDEDELKATAKEMFDELDENEKKQWSVEGNSKSKRRTEENNFEAKKRKTLRDFVINIRK